MAVKNNNYTENGISISPKTLSQNQTIKLSYEGLLAKAGATEIYAHIGYGERWEDQATYPMNSKNGKFEVAFQVKNPGTLNLCFKDALDNWDNNSSENYTFSIKEPSDVKSLTPSKTEKKIVEKAKTDKTTKTDTKIKVETTVINEEKPKKTRAKKSEV